MAQSKSLSPLKLPAWTSRLPRRSTAALDGVVLKKGIQIFSEAQKLPKKAHPLFLPEQPFDSLILTLSPLFTRSRKMFMDQGGRFLGTLLSSPRTLSSPDLVEQVIEYSPIQKELVWAATDPIESSSSILKRLMDTRAYSTSLFHEQNHRILWKFLPPPPPVRKKEYDVHRYLNFVESLVVALDMALGDELKPEVSGICYLSGITYDPGSDLRRKSISRRNYRNYLHACLYVTYLSLELYERKDIEKIVNHLYPFSKTSGGQLTKRAIDRACRLDEAFIRITNLEWQEKNIHHVVKKLSNKRVESLVLAKDPLDNRLQYIWAEKWFEKMGL